jgi:hypothetical protein
MQHAKIIHIGVKISGVAASQRPFRMFLVVLKSHATCENTTRVCQNHTLACQNHTFECLNHTHTCQNQTRVCENHSFCVKVTLCVGKSLSVCRNHTRVCHNHTIRV